MIRVPIALTDEARVGISLDKRSSRIKSLFLGFV